MTHGVDCDPGHLRTCRDGRSPGGAFIPTRSERAVQELVSDRLESDPVTLTIATRASIAGMSAVHDSLTGHPDEG